MTGSAGDGSPLDTYHRMCGSDMAYSNRKRTATDDAVEDVGQC